MLDKPSNASTRSSPDEDRPMQSIVPLINSVVALAAGAGIAGCIVFESDRGTVSGPTFPEYGPVDLLVVVSAIAWFFCTGAAVGSAVRVYWTNRDAEQRHLAVVAFILGIVAATLPWWPMFWEWFGTHYRFG